MVTCEVPRLVYVIVIEAKREITVFSHTAEEIRDDCLLLRREIQQLKKV